MALFEKGRELLLSDGGWKSSGGAKFKCILLDMNDAGPNLNGWVITALTTTGGFLSTVTTQAAHGLQAGDIIEIFSVLGATGINGIQTVVSAPTTTTFTVQLAGTPGVYVSGGYVANHSRLQFLSEFVPSGGRIATSAALTGLTNTNGIAGAAGPVAFTNVPEAAEAMLIVRAAVLSGDADQADTAQRLIHLVTPNTAGTVGLPTTATGVDINMSFNAAGIFKI